MNPMQLMVRCHDEADRVIAYGAVETVESDVSGKFYAAGPVKVRVLADGRCARISIYSAVLRVSFNPAVHIVLPFMDRADGVMREGDTITFEWPDEPVLTVRGEND
jgi:hypothetical protein